MSSTDQPSVLTVCVPGTSAEPGALDLNQILAARRQASTRTAALGRDPGDCSRRDCSKSGSESDASNESASCNDSACGVKLDGEFASDPELNGRLIVCEDQHSDLNEPVASGGVSFFHADSGKKALELLRMLRFDLLVTGDRLPDMPIGHFLRRVRVAWPWQKWAMVGSSITTQDEIAARTLGAMAVFDAPPDWEVISSLAIAAADKAAGLKTSGLKTSGLKTSGLQTSGLKLAFAHEPGADRLSQLDPDRTQLIAEDQAELLRPLAAALLASRATTSGAARPTSKPAGSRRPPVVSRRVPKRSVG